MPVQLRYVITLSDGRTLAWGVPGFFSEREALGFETHCRQRLVEGAKKYRKRCDCRQTTSDGDDGDFSLRLSSAPSSKTLAAQQLLEVLLVEGRASIKQPLQRPRQQIDEGESYDPR